ncbi:terminase large subunit [Hyphomonas sp.]|uniref:terminase large subunit n=1 Tax=Hyphomonas sp. TaxID=87 RepID=UPI00391D614D
MPTPPGSTRFRLAGPDDADVAAFAERVRERRRLNAQPRLWGYRDQTGALWIFDPYEGDRAVRWIETFCRHRKGEWAGKPLKLAPWQRRIIRQLFGWFGADGFRKHRTAWIEVPRKNGKSTLASAIALFLLVGDKEPAAEIYSIAGSEKQAKLVYDDAVAMVGGHPRLAAVIEATKRGMVHGESDSSFKPLGKANQHGLNPHGVIGDEVHEWKGRDQYEAMTTAQGTRRQPLSVFITTAGHDLASLCGELHLTALQVRQGLLYRPDLYVRIFAAAANDNWEDEATWAKANPGLKHGAPKLSALRDAYRKAKQSKAEENSFKRLHLNIWTDSVTAWISRENWDDRARPIDWQKLVGARCYAGLDLAKVKDLSALALLFPPDNPAAPGKWVLALKYWCPADNIRERTKTDGVNYQAWADMGLITATDGEVTDFDRIEADIQALRKLFQIEGLGFDPFMAQQLVQHLIDTGLPCAEVRQGFLTLGPPTAELERMVIGDELVHGGHAIMNWNVANTVLVIDDAGNMKPSKVKSVRRIDGVAATLNALALSMTVEVSKPADLSGFLSNPIIRAA